MPKKEKIGVSLSVETIILADETYGRFGFSSRSELIDAAINKYVMLQALGKYPDELEGIYNSIEARGIKEMEDRMASMLYKVAVEIAQVNLLLTEDMELNDRMVGRLRRDAVRLVKVTGGVVSLKQATNNGSKWLIQK
jgi:metal-responsive CopG/Arc/MetJ family transcriptional regulator